MPSNITLTEMKINATDTAMDESGTEMHGMHIRITEKRRVARKNAQKATRCKHREDKSPQSRTGHPPGRGMFKTPIVPGGRPLDECRICYRPRHGMFKTPISPDVPLAEPTGTDGLRNHEAGVANASGAATATKRPVVMPSRQAHHIQLAPILDTYRFTPTRGKHPFTGHDIVVQVCQTYAPTLPFSISV